MTPLVLQPQSEAELGQMVRAAQGPVSLRGGGTRGVAYGPGTVLETAGLSGITLYEPGALTLVAGAGTPLAEVEAVLVAQGQRLAFEAPDLRRALQRQGVSTLGGVVATNASGPRRVQAGAARDHLIGVRFVDGMGTIVKSGGRVMKNVTGLDLVKLMAGSHGTLGVITEVAFKLQAVPECAVTLQTQVPLSAGLGLLRRALGSPFEVSGAAYGPFGAALRVEGMEASVRYRAAALKALLGGDWVETAGDALWAGVRDAHGLDDGALWRVSCKPTAAEGVVGALAGVAHQATFDWGGGLIWIAVQGVGDAGAALIRGAVAGVGHATLMRGRGAAAFAPEAAGVAALSRALRAQFDPKGILNAGIMG